MANVESSSQRSFWIDQYLASFIYLTVTLTWIGYKRVKHISPLEVHSCADTIPHSKDSSVEKGFYRSLDRMFPYHLANIFKHWETVSDCPTICVLEQSSDDSRDCRKCQPKKPFWTPHAAIFEKINSSHRFHACFPNLSQDWYPTHASTKVVSSLESMSISQKKNSQENWHTQSSDKCSFHEPYSSLYVLSFKN
jgi:hypothetical protein